jgi:hypothetical protein
VSSGLLVEAVQNLRVSLGRFERPFGAYKQSERKVSSDAFKFLIASQFKSFEMGCKTPKLMTDYNYFSPCLYLYSGAMVAMGFWFFVGLFSISVRSSRGFSSFKIGSFY